MSEMTLGEISQISLLTPIKKGPLPGDPRISWCQNLELVIRVAMSRVREHGLSPLRNVTTLVFAQWNILDLEGPGDGWLLLNAAFNGDPEQYLFDLIDIVDEEMDLIYDHCIGYPGSRNRDAFLEYARRHRIETHVFYPTSVLRKRTVRDLRDAVGLGLD